MSETNLDKFKAILDDQRESGIKSGDWDRLDFTLHLGENGTVKLVIDSLKVGFVFSTRGNQRLIGAYNWKQ